MLDSAYYLLDSAKMYSDPFSDILKLMRVEALVTGGFNAGGTWAIRFPVPQKIKFFAVVKGSCWVHIDGEASPIQFNTGDVGLLAARRSFVMASDLAATPVDAMSLFSCAGTTTWTVGDGDDFAQIGGHVLLDPASGRFLENVLPPWIHVPATSSQATKFRWLLAQLVEERAAEQIGGHLAAAQLAQLLFIQILRAHSERSDAMPTGWLRALGDTRIAPAMQLMHSRPDHAWQLDDLAKACAMSRSTFAFHFRTVAGITPLSYLTEWRIRLAERALRDEATPVSLLARSLGYASESAFSNAFKRVNGRSPQAYRNAMRAEIDSVSAAAAG